MDGTTDNGGDCVCRNDCNMLRPVYNEDEPKKQTIPTYVWVVMGCLGAVLFALFIGLTTAACFQANNSAVHPRSIVDNPGESTDFDRGWVIYRSVGPTVPRGWATTNVPLQSLTNQQLYGYAFAPALSSFVSRVLFLSLTL